MLRTLYPFNSSDPGTLNANADDLFCGISTDGSKMWTQVVDDKGTVGYLPTNYLEFCNWTDKKFTLLFIDDGIERIHGIASAIGKYTNMQHEHLRIISGHRSRLLNDFETCVAQIKEFCPSRPQAKDSSDSVQPHKFVNESTSTSELSNQHTVKDPEPSNQQAAGDHVTSSEDCASSSHEQTIAPEVMAAKLTEVLRFKTGLSHGKSKIGITAILDCLLAHNVSIQQIPGISLAVEQDEPLTTADAAHNHDIIEMNSIFESITECKDDSQQRSWHLHDDENYILEKLTRLLEILTSGNRDALVSAIRQDLDRVHNLVLYYQMETRSTIRAIMLQIFAALCAMSAIFITTLLCSVLTPELVRDLMSTKDEQRLTFSAIVLSMLFSTGEQMPFTYNEFLSESFVDFLLDKIERSESHKEADVCLELLLSFNQHFADVNTNIVLLRLSQLKVATLLTQALLKLFNEGEDPVRVIPNEEQMSSVLKFVIDLYSLEGTSQLLYTNDVKVLIDIIIRQLTDLSDQDRVRTDYLSLMQMILANSDYNDHCHRKDDLITALNQIEFNEEATTSQSEMDTQIVREIRKLL